MLWIIAGSLWKVVRKFVVVGSCLVGFYGIAGVFWVIAKWLLGDLLGCCGILLGGCRGVVGGC